MHLKHLLRGALLAFLYLPTVWAASPEGFWTTVDDKTGRKRADVHLTVSNGVLNGTVVGVHHEPGDNSICAECPGDFKNKPVIGLQFIWGLKEAHDGTWEGGHILDAKTGRIYRVKMKVKGDKLYVRGYYGVSLLGRTQVWVHN